MITRDASGLFYNLHRAVTFFWFLLCLAVLYYIYANRRVFEPAVEYYQVWRSAAAEPTRLDHVEGSVFRVLSGNAFQFSTGGGGRLTCTLAGLELPPFQPGDPRSIELKERSREALSKIVLSNRVSLEITFPQPTLALGMARIGSTNVSVALLRSGMAELQPEFIRGYPVDDQYQMIQAEKQAKAEKRGIWAESGSR